MHIDPIHLLFVVVVVGVIFFLAWEAKKRDQENENTKFKAIAQRHDRVHK